MDVTKLHLHESYFNTAVRHFGTVDILVNNAGRSQRALWENIDISVDKDMFELNVFATLNLSRVAVRFFNTKGTGHIAVTSSVTGIIGIPFSATYTGSKHSLHVSFLLLRFIKLYKIVSGLGILFII